MISIEEHQSVRYAPRTFVNANAADLTVAFAVDFGTAGEQLTAKAAGDNYVHIPFHTTSVQEAADKIRQQIRRLNARIINVAGNGIYTFEKWGISQDKVTLFVCDVFRELLETEQIRGIRSGGQTGADMAGAVAAQVFGIDAAILFPRGYLQRDAKGRDYSNRPEAIRQWIEDTEIRLYWS